MRSRHWCRPANRAAMLLWLRLCGSATQSESDQPDE
jgi:hypothetical protein